MIKYSFIVFLIPSINYVGSNLKHSCVQNSSEDETIKVKNKTNVYICANCGRRNYFRLWNSEKSEYASGVLIHLKYT